MENKKNLKIKTPQETPVLKLVSAIEDILSLENHRVFKDLINSLTSMSGEVTGQHLSSEPFPIISPVNRTLH